MIFAPFEKKIDQLKSKTRQAKSVLNVIFILFSTVPLQNLSSLSTLEKKYHHVQ